MKVMRNKGPAALPTVSALALALALVFSGCPTGGNDNGDNGNGNNGNGNNNGGNGGNGNVPNLRLQGQVWEYGDLPSGEWGVMKFGGNLNVSSVFGGTGGVSDGLLDFTVGQPAAGDLEEIMYSDFTGRSAEYVTINPDNTMVAWLYVLNTTRVGAEGVSEWVISKVFNDYSYGDTYMVTTEEYVRWVFVDRDVTVTGKQQDVPSTEIFEDFWGPESVYEAFELELTHGWNAVHFVRRDDTTFEGYESSTVLTESVFPGYPSPERPVWELSPCFGGGGDMPTFGF